MAITTAEWLFKIPVTWIVPQYATLSDFAVNFEGIMLPSDEYMQKAMMYSDTMYTVPTASMAELLAEKSMELAIADPHQAMMVYEKIMQHLANWRDLMAKPQFAIRDCPIVGLGEFNELARKLFTPSNRHHYAIRHRNRYAEGINSLLGGIPSTTMQSTAAFNGSIFIEIQNRYNALKVGKVNFWEAR